MTSGAPEILRLPPTRPIDDAAGLWWLQCKLLPMAESLLGPRDGAKKILQPEFNNDPQRSPHTRHTPSGDGAFVKLSRKAVDRWSLVVFQMAHETIHLLNPVVGDAKTLEEGVAFEFSLYVQPFFVEWNGRQLDVDDQMPSYRRALRLVRELPGGVFDAGRRIRERVGALENVTVAELEELFPAVDKTTASKLAERFDRDSQEP